MTSDQKHDVRMVKWVGGFLGGIVVLIAGMWLSTCGYMSHSDDAAKVEIAKAQASAICRAKPVEDEKK